MADRMFEAFSNGKNPSEMMGKEANFKSNLEQYASSVSSGYLRHGLDMNKVIAKIASTNNLNANQIQRVIEESNNKVYLAKYAQMKNSNDREVSFDRADMEKVSTFLGSESTDMSKIASSADEPRTAFNSTRNLTGSLTPAAPMSLTKMVAEKLASDLSVASGMLSQAHCAFDAHIYKIAEMMFRYDRAGVDTNTCFDEICRKNNFNVPIQNIIQEAADDIIEMEKKANNINADYSLKLPFVDLGLKPSDYSLGSFSKIASSNLQTKQSRYFPVIQVHGTLIRNLSDMVKFASHLNTLFDEVSEKESIFKTASEKATVKKSGENDAE